MSDERTKKKAKLKPQHQIVVNEIAKGANQTEAYQKAYPSAAPDTARVNASRLLTNANISDALQKRINRALNHHQVTPEEVLGSAVFNMRTSMDDLMDEDGFFDLTKARETGAVDLIKEIEFVEIVDLETKEKTVKHKVKFESPAAARKEVANYIGLENFENPKAPISDEEMFVVLFNRIITKGELTAEEIVFGLKRQERFKDIDETRLLNA